MREKRDVLVYVVGTNQDVQKDESSTTTTARATPTTTKRTQRAKNTTLAGLEPTLPKEYDF